MKNLLHINVDCIAQFRSIANDKKNLQDNPRKTRILALEPALTPRYTLYAHHFLGNTLEQIPTIAYSPQERSDLLHCYLVSTDSLNQLIRSIKENQHVHLRGICQFCGINTDSSTDHYLPKGSYPDFCVNPLNLLPCCPDCNWFKNEYLWDIAHNSRGIINLYLDTLPEVQFLYVDIAFVDDVPTANFTTQNNNGIPNQLYQIIDRHFERLHLVDRYKEQFNSIYHQTYFSFKDKPRFAGHPGRVRDFLLSDAQMLFQFYGRNYYKGIIKEALANCAIFINRF